MFSMTIAQSPLRIRCYPDPSLRARAIEVDPSDPEVQEVAKRMIQLMIEANGAGLAAPQIGLPWRLFVTRDPETKDGSLTWVNPIVTPLDSEPDTDIEGCLSLPGIEVEVTRPSLARISAMSDDGSRFEVESNLLARVWQHEMDHLEGVLIIDRMSTMERIKNRRKLKELKKAAAT